MRMDIWLEAREAPIGLLERADNKALTFTYTDRTEAARISLSLPVSDQPYADAACRGFFDNLLFEGRELDRVLASYKVDRDDTGALLFHLGADCPGAISITPEGTGPGKRPGVFPDDYDKLDPAQVHDIVRSLHLHRRLPDGSRDPSPLPGVQGKIAVVYRDGDYYLPKAGTRAPTTHILKVSPKADPELTRQECALLTLSTACGIRTTNFEAHSFDADDGVINAICVERFDRTFAENTIGRFHAEDFCQALGLPPFLKYERNSLSRDHRFSAAAVGALAGSVSVPAAFLQGFLDQTLFNLLVGNTDNHGKNSSILYRAAGTELAPLYDVVPVFMDKRVTHALAFRLGDATFAEDLTQDDFLHFMTDLGYRRPRLDRSLLARMQRIATAVSDTASDLAGKRMADALAEQLAVISSALNVDLEFAERDYFGRQVRDEGQTTGGWDVLS